MARGNLVRALLSPVLDRGAGDAVAIREPKRVWTYKRLLDESTRAAAAFIELGLHPGERIALVAHDSMETAAAFLGALWMGAVPTPLNMLLRPHELRSLLCDSGAAAVVVSSDLGSSIDAIRAELPAVRHVLAVGGARSGELDFQALIRQAEPLTKMFEPDSDSLAFLLYSAGAASHPKGVAHRHEAPVLAHAAYAKSLLGMVERDRVFATARLSTAYGLGLGLLFPLLSGAATFLLPSRPRPRAIFDVIAAFRPTLFAATPSVYGQMAEDYVALAPPRLNYFETVRHAISGGEALPSALFLRIKEIFGVEPLHGFGATEALHFVLSNVPGEPRLGSSGRPLEGIEARVVDTDGRPVGPEEIGTLELRGPTVARGYFGQEAVSEALMHGDGWVRPGDRFLVDREGHFFYCGRVDDLFKVGGRWVVPAEVERTLLAHPAVWQCAVVEGHDGDGLSQPVAFVVPNLGHAPNETLAAQLMEFVKSEIAPYKYPRAVEFVEALPRDKAGQVMRWRLRREAAAVRGASLPR